MIIRNAIIILNASSIDIPRAELENFTGNVVLTRDRVPADLMAKLMRLPELKELKT